MSDTAQFDRVSGVGNADGVPVEAPNALNNIAHAGVFAAPEERALFWVSLAIALCCVGLFVYYPDALVAWLCAGIFVPLGGVLVRFVPGLAEASPELRRGLARTLLLAGLMVLCALGLRLAESLEWLSIDVVRRLIGVTVGGVLAFVGMKLPTRLLPSALMRFELPLAVRLVRLVGATAMFGGGAYALLWLVAPLAQANVWGSVVLGCLAALLGLRCTLLVHGFAGAPGGREPRSRTIATGQKSPGSPADDRPRDPPQSSPSQMAGVRREDGQAGD